MADTSLFTRLKRLFSTDVIVRNIGGDELKIIDVFVCKLRKKVAEALGSNDTCIETVWGRGYVLRSPASEPMPKDLLTSKEETPSQVSPRRA